MALFTASIFTEGILPFILIFVLMFAVLQKSKIFGEGKSQIDALVSLVVALILIGVPAPRNFIVSIIPWLAVALVVLLIVLVIYGMGGEYDSDAKKGLNIPGWFSKALLIVAIIFVLVLVLVYSGWWESIVGSWNGSGWMSNIILLVIIGVVLWIALKN